MSKPQWLKELLESNGDESRLKSELIRLYDEYSKLKGQVEGSKEISEMNFQLKKKISDLNVQIHAMSLDKKLLNEIKVCNIYRKTIEELESTSGNNEMNNERRFPIYNMIFKAMVEIYVVERKMGTDRKTLNTTGEYCEIFMERLTRTERWRILITWFFFEDMHIICQRYDSNDLSNVNSDTASTEETTLNNLYKTLYNIIREENDKFREDCNSLNQSTRLQNLLDVKIQIIKKFKTPRGSMEAIISEIAFIAQAFQEGFDQCDEKMKIVEDLTFTPVECAELYELILGIGMDLPNRIAVRKCFNIIVGNIE